MGAAVKVAGLTSAMLVFPNLFSGAAEAQTTEALFYDDLDNGFSSGAWDQYGRNGIGNFIQGRTKWKNKSAPTGAAIIDRYQAPSIIRNFSSVQLSSYVPGDMNLFYGTEFLTQSSFGPPALNQAIDFEACVNLNSLPSGAVAAMYPYRDDYNPTTRVITSDELDFEYLGTFDPTRFLATAFDDFQRKDGKAITPYNNGINHAAFQKPMLRANGQAISRNRFHCIKIRWLRTSSGFSQEWYTKEFEEDDYKLVHKEQNVKPNQAMKLHLNIWVPQSDFDDAYDSGLVPFRAGEYERFYSMDVDWVKVTRVSGVQSAPELPLTSPSTPVAAPPPGIAPSPEPFSFNTSLTPYGPNTNTALTATPYIYQPEKYDLTYRFSVNGYVMQNGTNPVLNLATPGFGDHGDIVAVTVFARNKTTNERGIATQSATVVNTAPTANDVSANAQSGQEIIIPLSGSDLDGDALTFQRVGGPTNGTGGIFLDTNGQYKMRYTSRSNFTGVETVRFVSKDSLDRTSPVATMTINVGSGGGS